MQNNKALISIVLFLGLIIISGLALLGFGIYKRATNQEFKLFNKTPAEAAKKSIISDGTVSIKTRPTKNIAIPLTKQEWIQQVTTSNNSIIVHINSKTKNVRLLILDANNGSIISEIKFEHHQ